MSLKTIKFPNFADDRGILTVVEDELPFTIERVFWINGTDGEKRGGHGHKKTVQAAIAITGRVDMLMDNGREQTIVALDSPEKCLIIEPEYWHEMKFHTNATLLVFASEKYDADDYIHERPSA